MERPSENNLKVLARFRPLIDIELALTESSELSLKYIDETTVGVPNDMKDFDYFSFDKVFDSKATQKEVFEYVGLPIIDDVLTGYNGTVIAYGQTGSGKTFTMMGSSVQNDLHGVIPRSLAQIFRNLSTSSSEIEYCVKCSMVEIYKETLKDLLGSNSELKIKQDKRKGIFIEGLTEVYVVNEEETLEVLAMGEANRTVASTKMNNVSSRSHQLLIVEIMQKLPNGSEKRGILNLVDLAGSEKINQTGATGNKLEEAKKINLSLSALGNVIKALTEKAEHIPYRDSKLTRLLQESLGGNYKTTLIVNCSPHPRNVEDTLNTLKFARRAKTIKNKAMVNIKNSPETYLRIIEELQKRLDSTLKELEAFKSEKSPSALDPLKLEDQLSISSLPALPPDIHLERQVQKTIKLEELLETISSLKEDQEHFKSRIQDLESELQKEIRSRIKVEKEFFEVTSRYGKLVNKRKSVKLQSNHLTDKTSSLEKQVDLLQFHLRTLSQRYSINLEKLSKGEIINEWEFTDMVQFPIDKNSKLPVYSDDESLDVLNTSEYNVDVPIRESILLANDRYAQGICSKIVEKNDVNKELMVFELKKQFIQSGLINCELTRSYFDILWKYKLLREKLNLKTKVIKTQKERISTYEVIQDSLYASFNKLTEVLEKIEQDSNIHENHQDLALRGKIVRYVKPQARQQTAEFVRLNNRVGTTTPAAMQALQRRCSVNLNFGNHQKFMFIESNIQKNMIFNDQLQKTNNNIVSERNSYKKLLDDLTRENDEVYNKEKNRWRQYIEEFKSICEDELIRKQNEINKLNELLGRWIHKYLELEERYESRSSCKVLDSQYKVQVEELLKHTKIHMRPIKFNIQESPLHCRFKSLNSGHISTMSGDSSPPSFD